MDAAPWSVLEWLSLVQHELLLFAAVFFVLGALDELAVDAIWIWLRLTKRTETHTMPREDFHGNPLLEPVAVLIPTWREEAVIGHTIAHALKAWPHQDLCIYVGCYANDTATPLAVGMASGGDPRVRIVIVDRRGPTTKGDCLNGLYAAMELDERRRGMQYGMILLHDAEDMVDPCALDVLDLAIEQSDYVQLPVLALPQKHSRWIGSHYCEEFAESHAKTLVVREALSAGIPAAGVGCAFHRQILHRINETMPGAGPFSADTLTEDYELGLRIKAMGGTGKFLRVRGDDGRLVATRAYFPADIGAAVRQKSRWIQGIALQGWQRLGWGGGPAERWMRLRDRRAPLNALVLFAGYMLLALSAAIWIAGLAGSDAPQWQSSPYLYALLAVNVASLVWRAAMRFAFTAREFGLGEGMRAVMRIPVSNIIAMICARRAVFSYMRGFRGRTPRWDKTIHLTHPAAMAGHADNAAA